MTVPARTGGWGAEKLLLLGVLAWSLISRIPQRFGRIVRDLRQAPTGVVGWLVVGLSGAGTSTLRSWVGAGLLGGVVWAGRLLLHLAELAGLGEVLQLLWGLIFRMRPLTEQERAASASVHPPGLIRYRQVRVHDDSALVRIGVVLARMLHTKVSPGAITTMHLVHAPAAGLGTALAVHELTHVAQYEKIGAAYIPEALHAQGSAAGYDYGDLTTARAGALRFADFNREQQAGLCADYHRVCHGTPAEFGATKAELAPFVADMRSGRF